MTNAEDAGFDRESYMVRTTGGAHKARMIKVGVDGAPMTVGAVWGRGAEAKFLPNQPSLTRPGAIERFVLDGLLPEEPFIDAGTKIAAFGSCFAENISNYLNTKHFNVLTKKDVKAYVVSLGEGMVNSYAIRQQFEWALENASVNDELWHDKKAEIKEADEETRLNTRDIFMETDVFILTFGLSEVWYSKITGDVFWRGVPTTQFNEAEHGFRVVTVEQNRSNIEEIYRLIRKHRPNAKIVFTLSPVPLVATFRTQQCMVANTTSKASLRVAIDEVVRAHEDDKGLFYWPSYEIVTEFFSNAYMLDRRHPRGEVVFHTMRLFEEFFCVKAPTAQRLPLIHTLTDAMMATNVIGPSARAALRSGDKQAVKALAEKERRLASGAEKRSASALKRKDRLAAWKLSHLAQAHATMSEILDQAAEGYDHTLADAAVNRAII